MMKHVLLELLRTRRSVFIVLLALLLILVGLLLFGQLYQQPRLALLQKQWSEKRALLAGGQGDVSAAYRQGAADLEAFYARIPAKLQFTRVLADFYEVASNNSLKVIGINYKPEPVKGENLLVYGVTLQVAGKYAGIKSFLADIQCRPEFFVVDGISLSSGSSTEEMVGLKLQLSLYLQKDGK